MFDTVFVARGAEERAVRDGLSRTSAHPLVVGSGIGPRAGALAAATAFESGRPHRALVIGTCGALVPSLRVGDVLLYSRVRSLFEAPFALDPSSAASVFSAYPDALSGIHGISVDRIATRPSEKRALSARFQTHAVDMETYEIVRALHAQRVPVAVVRIVSDDSSSELPDLNRALTGSGEVDPASLALALLAKPIATLRLGASGNAAVQKFAPVLEAIFGS